MLHNATVAGYSPFGTVNSKIRKILLFTTTHAVLDPLPTQPFLSCLAASGPAVGNFTTPSSPPLVLSFCQKLEAHPFPREASRAKNLRSKSSRKHGAFVGSCGCDGLGPRADGNGPIGRRAHVPDASGMQAISPHADLSELVSVPIFAPVCMRERSS